MGRVALLLAVFAVFCVVSHQATIDYCEVLHNSLLFYEAQRSGRLPSTNRIPWRGNSALKDCTATGCTYDAYGDGNLAGGYYDAGDGVKFGLPGAWSLTVLAWGLLEFKSAVVACREYDYYLDALKWGLDWWIKAHPTSDVMWGQVGEGGPDHGYWGPPESMTYTRNSFALTPSKPGTELAMEVAAAFAAGAIAFREAGNTAYANVLETKAKSAYDFGDKYRGNYVSAIPDAGSFYNSWSGFNDEIAWGSAWLYRLTRTSSYLSKAQAVYGSLQKSGSFDWDNKGPGAIVLLAQLTQQASYISDANSFLNWWKPGGGVGYTNGGMAWISGWGPCRYTANAAFLAAVVSGNTTRNSWVQGQTNYMLGVNARSQSFVVGYGPNAPKNPHHRAAHGSTTNSISNPAQNKYILLGALVGGPGQDDSYVDDRTDYQKNEVALDYNAGFTGAVAALAGWFPGGFSTGPATGTTGTTGSSSSSGGSCGAGTSQGSGCSGVKFTLDSGTSTQWIGIKNPVEGISAAVATLEFKQKDGSFSTMKYETWGAWTATGPSLALPWSIRVNLCNGVSYTFDNLITSISTLTYCGAISSSTSGSSTTGGSTAAPTAAPTTAPTATRAPTAAPTTAPTATKAPTAAPTRVPTAAPTATRAPTATPTTASTGSIAPTAAPSKAPTTKPGTAAPTAVPTSTPSRAATAAPTNPGITVYTDGLQNGFQDWSWSSTRNFDSTTSPRTGTKAIEVSLQAWGALYLNGAGKIDTSKVKGLELYARLVSGSTTKFEMRLVKSGSPVGKLEITPSTTYQRYYLDFDAANSGISGVYDGLWIQEVSGVTNSLFVDDIVLIGR